MAEEKGLIGKAWDAVQDILKNMTSSGKQAFMTKLAQEDRQFVIDAFKKNWKNLRKILTVQLNVYGTGQKEYIYGSEIFPEWQYLVLTEIL